MKIDQAIESFAFWLSSALTMWICKDAILRRVKMVNLEQHSLDPVQFTAYSAHQTHVPVRRR